MELSVIQAQMLMRTRMERGEHPALQRRFRLAPAIPVSTSDHAGRHQTPQKGHKNSDNYGHDRAAQPSLLDFVA